MKLLHFADAHIDMANYGRHDPVSGLPFRVLDFLNSLDVIVDTAISEKVDLVLFAGDAYKDRSPAPTFQREWGRRIIRLSQAKIPTLLLIGNHDLSPAAGRANAVHEFDTLQVPYVQVLSKIQFLKPEDLWGLPLQVISLPWISRSAFLADYELNGEDVKDVFALMESRVIARIEELMDLADNSLPLILTAHTSIQGAKFGSERTVMLGSDMVIPASLVKNTHWDYVALGHIHKPQDINEGFHPPVVYPGSIERVDFGESKEKKYFVIAEVERGSAKLDWRNLEAVRRFTDCRVTLTDRENVNETLLAAMPQGSDLDGAILRFTIEYPRDFESLIDEPELRKRAAGAFEFHLVLRPQTEVRIRLPADEAVGSLSPLDLLDQYWRTSHSEPTDELRKLAREIIEDQAAADYAA